jgi:general secretion pathway protein A
MENHVIQGNQASTPSVRASNESAYLAFLGLKNNPFPVAPDNQNFYMSAHTDQVLTNIVHGIIARKGFMVLTGDVGLGKTTISRKILPILEEKGVETSLVFQTSFQDVELLKEINRDFGLKNDSHSFGDQMKALSDFLLTQNRQGRNCAIIIDDAQNLTSKSLELVRMISNLEADQQKLVQILLIGQPELSRLLNTFELRQLKSRIIIQEVVIPLSMQDLKNYLAFKLNVSGCHGRVGIQNGAFRKLYRFTKGNLRQLNLLMDRCLYVAFLHSTTMISAKIVTLAIKDIQSQKFSAPIRPFWRLAAISLILGCLLAGGYWSHENEVWSLSALWPKLEKTGWVVSKGQADTKADIKDRSSLAVADNQQIDHYFSIPEAVTKFFSAYRLSKYAAGFFEALSNKQLLEFGEIIFKETGFELIRLDRIPGFIKKQLGALAYPLGPNGTNAYFYLWRPVIRLKHFYPSYRGEDIHMLQKKLKRLQYYHQAVDGAVNHDLIDAVNRFQRHMMLPVTGYPDKNTIFYMCQLEKQVP